jgi:predicted RNA-binding Zn ribbon-like protein
MGYTHYTCIMATKTADGDEFRFRAGRGSLDLCSTVLWRLSAPVELLRSPADLARWRAEAGLGTSRNTPTEADLTAARQLREAIYRVVGARVQGARLPRADVAVVNAAARQPCLAPGLSATGELLPHADEPFAAALSSIARDAIELVAGPWADRVRECEASDCAFLFVDTSRPGNRRWCAMNRCGNREHVRGHRRRARQDAEGG